jgi:hypothetical protein
MSMRIHTAMVGQRSGQGADAGCATYKCATVGYQWPFARRLIGRCCDTHQQWGIHFGAIHAISAKPPPPGTRPDRHTTMTCLTPAKRSLPDWSPYGPESREPLAVACRRTAMRHAERSIMSVKSKGAGARCARQYARDAQMCGAQGGRGRRWGRGARTWRKKGHTPSPPGRKCCSVAEQTEG